MSSLAVWKVIDPDSYYRSFIDKKIRPDGRGWEKARPIKLTFGSVTSANGSATVRMGNTSVVCGVKAEIAVPTLQNPKQGFLVPNIEIHPCSSPAVKAGAPGEKAMNTSQLLENIIKSSEMINLESLGLVPNKVCWCLYCDIACLDLDGNLIDAALLSLVSALQDTMLPKVAFDDETKKIKVAKSKTERLNLKTCPISTTFSCYSQDIHLIDPTYEDENEGNGEVTVVLKDPDTVGLLHKSGGQTLTSDTLQKFIEVAKSRRKTIVKIIDKARTVKDNKNSAT